MICLYQSFYLMIFLSVLKKVLYFLHIKILHIYISHYIRTLKNANRGIKNDFF
ncbi:hypothetical protein MADA3029_740089 [Vibrio nigripulchritudo MADA3029]|nr:hypothetical protein VIBNIMADA3020_710023 [Vibrio nigripulchritudo MADA3020]CCN61238.1 hypothetical protein MADA3029_740089 [Vibrio nigripulchritudo MADA3029]